MVNNKKLVLAALVGIMASSLITGGIFADITIKDSDPASTNIGVNIVNNTKSITYYVPSKTDNVITFTEKSVSGKKGKSYAEVLPEAGEGELLPYGEYTFDSWYTDSNYTTLFDTSAIIGDNPVTLYARYAMQDVIRFYDNNEQAQYIEGNAVDVEIYSETVDLGKYYLDGGDYVPTGTLDLLSYSGTYKFTRNNGGFKIERKIGVKAKQAEFVNNHTFLYAWNDTGDYFSPEIEDPYEGEYLYVDYSYESFLVVAMTSETPSFENKVKQSGDIDLIDFEKQTAYQGSAMMINVLPAGYAETYDAVWGTENSSIVSFRINLQQWQFEYSKVAFSIYAFAGSENEISGPYTASNEHPYIDVNLDAKWDSMIFLRHSNQTYLSGDFWGNVWNKTSDIKIDHKNTTYTITSMGSGLDVPATLTIE